MKARAFTTGLGISALGLFSNEGVTEAWPWPSLLRRLQRRNRNAIWCPVYTCDTRTAMYTFQGLRHPHPTAWLLCSLCSLSSNTRILPALAGLCLPYMMHLCCMAVSPSLPDILFVLMVWQLALSQLGETIHDPQLMFSGIGSSLQLCQKYSTKK